MKTLKQHHQDVQKILEKLKSSVDKQPLFSRGKLPSNTMRQANYSHIGHQLGIDSLDQLISIDKQEQVAWVEPGMPMDRLTKELLAQGFVLPVTPEFKGITVGGAISGAAIESSSFAYGQFSDNCLAYDVLLGDGTLLRIDHSHHEDLFYAISGAYGTFCLITLVGLRLVKAKPWVVLNYQRFYSISAAVSFMREVSLEKTCDFVEGIMYSSNAAVVITGTLTEDSEVTQIKQVKVNQAAWSPWFFQDARSHHSAIMKMSIFDYLFRHDRGAFWMGAYATYYTLFLRYYLENHCGLKKTMHWLFGKLRFADYAEVKDPNIFFRFLFGWSMTSRRLYKMLHAHTEHWFAERFLIQDYYIPFEHAVSFVDKIVVDARIFPLWLCPVKQTHTPQLFSPHYSAGKLSRDELYLDVGVYGLPSKNQDLKQLNRNLDAFCKVIQGRKMLYSYNFYSFDEFWEIYSYADYSQLRRRYKADKIFVSIEDKLGLS